MRPDHNASDIINGKNSIILNSENRNEKSSLLKRFKRSNDIETISITGCPLKKKNIKRLCAGLIINKNIKHISLNGLNSKKDDIDSIVSALLTLTNVRTLWLGYTISSHINIIPLFLRNNPYISSVDFSSGSSVKDKERDISLAYEISKCRYLTYTSLSLNPSVEFNNALKIACAHNANLSIIKISFDVRTKIYIDNKSAEMNQYFNYWIAFKAAQIPACGLNALFQFVQNHYPALHEKLAMTEYGKYSNYADSLLADITPSPANMLCTMNLSGVCKSFLYILDGIRLPNIDPQAISSFRITQVDVARYTLNLARKDIILPHKITKEEFAAQCCL